MNLPRGITGFRHLDDPPLPFSDIVGFRAHCHAAAQRVGGRVLSVEESVGIARNFVEGVLELDKKTIRVLLNAHYPLIAFAAPSAAGPCAIAFIHLPKLAGVFAGFDVYDVLTPESMNEPLTPAACEQLAPAERDQLRYWRPKRIGEAVFNCWD